MEVRKVGVGIALEQASGRGTPCHIAKIVPDSRWSKHHLIWSPPPIYLVCGFANSAYKHGGILIGDIISTIDGQSVTTLTLSEVWLTLFHGRLFDLPQNSQQRKPWQVRERIAGEDGTFVTLGLVRTRRDIFGMQSHQNYVVRYAKATRITLLQKSSTSFVEATI